MKSARTARTILVRGGALIVTAGLVVGLAAAASAAVPTCQTSTATTTAYTVNVCINTPATSTTVSGDITAGATVSVPTGTSPGLTKTQWSINGVDLATDYQTPHQFTLSTKDFADGDYTIGVAGVMRDGYVTPATTVTVTFANGNATTPVNPVGESAAQRAQEEQRHGLPRADQPGVRDRAGELVYLVEVGSYRATRADLGCDDASPVQIEVAVAQDRGEHHPFSQRAPAPACSGPCVDRRPCPARWRPTGCRVLGSRAHQP